MCGCTRRATGCLLPRPSPVRPHLATNMVKCIRHGPALLLLANAPSMLPCVTAGNWVLLEGLDATITKTATLVPEFLDEEVHIMRPLQFHTQVLNLQLDISACSSFHKTSRSTSTERCGGTPMYHAGGFGQTHVVLLAFVSSPNVLGLHLF